MCYISLSRRYFLLNPHSDRHGHVFALATQNACIWTPGSLVITLNGFSALLLIRPALGKKKDFTLPLPPHSPIRAFTQGHLKQNLL